MKTIISLVLSLFMISAGPALPYKVSPEKDCTNQVKAFNIFLQTQAKQVVEDSKKQNPRFLEVKHFITKYTCIESDDFVVEVLTNVKILLATLGEDGKQKNVKLCSTLKELVEIRIVNGNYTATTLRADDQIRFVECE